MQTLTLIGNNEKIIVELNCATAQNEMSDIKGFKLLALADTIASEDLTDFEKAQLYFQVIEIACDATDETMQKIKQGLTDVDILTSLAMQCLIPLQAKPRKMKFFKHNGNVYKFPNFKENDIMSPTFSTLAGQMALQIEHIYNVLVKKKLKQVDMIRSQIAVLCLKHNETLPLDVAELDKFQKQRSKEFENISFDVSYAFAFFFSSTFEIYKRIGGRCTLSKMYIKDNKVLNRIRRDEQKK